MNSSGASGPDSIRAIDRAFEVLEILADHDSAQAMSDIADRAELPRPTVHRVLRTLAASGYVQQLANHRYRLGTRLIALARKAAGSLGASLRPLLVAAVEATHESVSVAILDGDEVRYIAHAASKQSVRVFQQVGNRASLHSTGVGKAILSAMDDDDAKTLIGKLVLTALTPYTITDPEALLAEVRRSRARGYTLDHSEQEIGVHCVAAPVPGPLPLAVSISGPEPRMNTEFIKTTCLPVLTSLVAQVRDASEQFPSAC